MTLTESVIALKIAKAGQFYCFHFTTVRLRLGSEPSGGQSTTHLTVVLPHFEGGGTTNAHITVPRLSPTLGCLYLY